MLRPVHKRGQDQLIGQSERNAARLAQNLKHNGLAVGFGHAKTGCERRGVLQKKISDKVRSVPSFNNLITLVPL